MSNETVERAEKGMDLTLDGELNIQNVADLKIQLAEALEKCESLSLDLENVSRIDLTTLQLLCSVHRTGWTHGKPVRISKTSDAVESAVDIAGLLRENMKCGQECSDNCLWLKH